VPTLYYLNHVGSLVWGRRLRRWRQWLSEA
jgi:hypothetical protein